ncbi:adhesion G-protein coupled receptor D1-like isoform X2 [Dreissena polymorpha]|uniref:adhesion G-protein coupled receptor D1-like isoform X2 n=1 Tax=Dreissena polymorpha TaxID=45954 RepID=UPI0022643A80|nr:adhesion G-protein coupled receptor D1-like isoform X2 [Dreissena polymorpha]
MLEHVWLTILLVVSFEATSHSSETCLMDYGHATLTANVSLKPSDNMFLNCTNYVITLDFRSWAYNFSTEPISIYYPNYNINVCENSSSRVMMDYVCPKSSKTIGNTTWFNSTLLKVQTLRVSFENINGSNIELNIMFPNHPCLHCPMSDCHQMKAVGATKTFAEVFECKSTATIPTTSSTVTTVVTTTAHSPTSTLFTEPVEEHCGVDTTIFGRMAVTWPPTITNETSMRPCPRADGIATRKCEYSSASTPPYWGHPDMSNCVSQSFTDIKTKTKRLFENKVSSADILEIAKDIRRSIFNQSGVLLYAGDLTVATDSVHVIAQAIKNIDAVEANLIEITQTYGAAIGSIIDPKLSDVWTYTSAGYLDSKVTSILSSVEQLSTHVAEHAANLRTARRKRETFQETTLFEGIDNNLRYRVSVLDRQFNFDTFDTSHLGREASIILPQEVFNKSLVKTSDRFIHVLIASFPTLPELMRETQNKRTQADLRSFNSELTKFLASGVLTGKILNVPEVVFSQLESPIRIQFLIQNESVHVEDNSLKQSCVFLNMLATSTENKWLTTGCTKSVSESNNSHVVCYCNHMTNFAVLMDVYSIEEKIDQGNLKALTYVSYAGGALSVLCCLISILVFECVRLNSQRVRINEQLAITIICLQMFFLFGIDRTENRTACLAMAICLHYFLLALFCWMLVEGANLYLVLVKVFKSRSHLKTYMAVGWGVPLVVVGVSAGILHEEYGSGTICWVSNNVLMKAVVPPIVFVILVNTIVLSVVMRIMFKSMSKGSKTTIDERSSAKSGLKAAAVLLPVLGLTWALGFLSITNKETLIFTYLFTILNSLQGVFFCVFHCLLSSDVRKAYTRRSERLSQKRLTTTSLSGRATMRRSSELDSYSKASVRTSTTAVSTLERPKSYQKTDFYDSRLDSQSLDEVFYANPKRDTSVHGDGNQLHRNSFDADPIFYDQDDSYHNHTANNIVRTPAMNGDESTNGYILYYGHGRLETGRAMPHYTDFTKNDFADNYAKVSK